MANGCRAFCRSGCLPDGTRITAVQYNGGRLPRDPATGEACAAGSYGAWQRCRTCAILIVWPKRFCPCCSRQMADRPKPTRVRRTERLAMSRLQRARLHGHDNNNNNSGNAPPDPAATPPPSSTKCQGCGAPLPSGSYVHRRYCTPVCSRRTRRRNLRDLTRPPRPCGTPGCTREIPAGAPLHRKACTRRCNQAYLQRLHRARVRAAEARKKEQQQEPEQEPGPEQKKPKEPEEPRHPL